MLHVEGFAADVSLDQRQDSLVAVDFRVRVDPVQRGRAALWVLIYMEDAPAMTQRQTLRQYHGRRGLGHAALEVADCDDSPVLSRRTLSWLAFQLDPFDE